MFRLNLSILIGSLLVGLVSNISAQEQPTKSTTTELGIEIVTDGHPFPFAVGKDDGAIETEPPPKRPDWKTSRDTPPLTRIKIHRVLDRDGVSIRIGAVFDDSQPADAPGPKYGEREQIIASYFARLDETISVTEFERWGFEPLVLKVTRYQPQPFPEASAKVLPEVINPLKSIAFVDLQSEEPKSHSYQLTLQNIGDRAVVALTFGMDRSSTQSLEGGAKPIILPGAVFKTMIGADASIPPETSPPTLAISAVLFDDGSYEGDVVAAAELAARSKGRQIQSLRSLELLRGIPDQPSPETIRAIQETKAAVEKLRIDVEVTLIEALQSQFPLLPRTNGKAWLAGKAMDGLKMTRTSVVFQLNELEQKLAQNQEGLDLNKSLARVRDRLARFAGN